MLKIYIVIHVEGYFLVIIFCIFYSSLVISSVILTSFCFLMLQEKRDDPLNSTLVNLETVVLSWCFLGVLAYLCSVLISSPYIYIYRLKHSTEKFLYFILRL